MEEDGGSIHSAKARGGKARMERLTPEERKELASAAARKRWSQQRIATRLLQDSDGDAIKQIPAAIARGTLTVGETDLPCYVLDNDKRDRVFSLKGAVVGLIETEGGQLAEYIKVRALRPFLPEGLSSNAEKNAIPALVEFDTGGEAPFRYALGLPVEKFMDLCVAYSLAADSTELTERQIRIAANANRFLRACAKVGIVGAG